MRHFSNSALSCAAAASASAFILAALLVVDARDETLLRLDWYDRRDLVSKKLSDCLLFISSTSL